MGVREQLRLLDRLCGRARKLGFDEDELTQVRRYVCAEIDNEQVWISKGAPPHRGTRLVCSSFVEGIELAERRARLGGEEDYGQ